jgi:hypothetical protein
MIEVSIEQWNILTYIRKYRDQHGRSPVLREIMSGCNCSSTTVYQHLMRMTGKGLVLRQGPSLRDIVLIDKPVGVKP